MTGGNVSSNYVAIQFGNKYSETFMTITGGKIVSEGIAIINTGGSIVEIGGNVKISAVKNAIQNIINRNVPTMNITGGEISNTGTEHTIYNTGTLTISGGTISSTNAEYTIYNDGGTVEQTGGTIVGNTNL